MEDQSNQLQLHSMIILHMD